MILDEQLDRGDLLFLDGGIGSEIERLGGEMHSAAWCGVANRTQPDLVRQVHESYISAGVDIVTANTFATCRHVLEAAGYGDETQAINRQAVELARQAIENSAPDRPIAIAGSMSNHMAFIPGTVAADPKLVPSLEQEAQNYREVADTLAEAGCDILIMEMMLDTERSLMVTEAAVSTGLPVWVGMSTSRSANGKMIAWDQASEDGWTIPEELKHHRTLPLEVIISGLLDLKPQVMGLMHSCVKSIQPGLDVLCELWDGPVMVYPEANGFDALAKAPLPVSPAELVEYGETWVKSGVQILGGCCGTTVHHIRGLTERLSGKSINP